MKLHLCLIGAAALVAACSGGAAPTTGPDETAPPGSTATAEPGQQTPAATLPPNVGGDVKARVRSLIPPGATQLSEVSAGDAYSVQVSSTQSLDQLGAFWTQAIPAAGFSETGRFTQAGTLTIAFSNPDGGVTAFEDTSTGGVIITISAGTQ